MRIGARIIKTGIAVMITMFICKTFSLEPSFFGAVSAVINMQPSIFLTLKTAKDQILVHILGVGAALIFGHLLGVNLFTMGLITVLTISLFIKLNLHSGITTGIVAALFVMGSGPQEFLPHALDRTAVIFAGLTTAMLVNILLWPPHYQQQFKAKLKETNLEAVRYFCQAVQDYVQLENEEKHLNQAQKNLAYTLSRESRILVGFFRRDRQLFTAESPEQGEWSAVAEKLVDYNRSLIEKADRIYDLLPGRLERRLKMGGQPLSDEFKIILEILASGCTTIDRVNAKLRAVIIEGHSAQPEEISEDYWERLNAAIDQWQPNLTGSYYLHALLEVAMVANEIKWASRRSKLLLYESTATIPPED